jgi:long-chain acyl-CoA synthetase
MSSVELLYSSCRHNGKAGGLFVSKPWLKNWPESVPQSIQYPDAPLFELLRQSAKMYPRNTAIVFFGKRMTYQELDALTDRFGAALNGLGVKKGDRVALFLPNMPEFVIAYYGALKTGAVVTAVSSLSKEREVAHQLHDAEAETVVVMDAFYPVVKAVLGKTVVKRVIVARMKDFMPGAKAFLGGLLGRILSGRVERARGVYFFGELLEKYASASPPSVKVFPKTDVAALQYTGGTTGVPKGAMLTHSNLLSNAVMCAEWLTARTSSEVFLTVLPLFHIYGMTTSMNAAVYLAGAMVLLPRFNPKEVLKTIEQYKVTIFCGVPTMYSVLVAHPDVGKYDLSSIKFCISGAAPLNVDVQRRFMKVTGGVLVEGYGLSECSPVTHCNPLDKSMRTVKVGSIGVPWPDTEAKIVDMKTGKDAKVGKIGELLVKGPQVMKGYWNMPEETDVVLRDEWLFTGDVGKMDENGYFYITDRKKDLIKYKGYSVYPRELEDVLMEHSAVKECAVVGEAEETAGEIPKAFIVLKEGASASEKELMDFVKERVASYKRIREIEFRKELPKTLMGKALRRELRKEETQKGNNNV